MGIDSPIGCWGINFPFVIQNNWKLQISQGYIIRILQHFATKLWNITNFVMLFQAVMKFLSRLVKINTCVIRGKVHWIWCRGLYGAQGTSPRTFGDIGIWSVCTWRHRRHVGFQFKIILIRLFSLEHQHGRHGFCWVGSWGMNVNALLSKTFNEEYRVKFMF
jgi:hypothetical protein